MYTPAEEVGLMGLRLATRVQSALDRIPLGEMVDLMWRNDASATARLEELWNELIKAHRVALFCSYCLEDNDEAERFPGELRALHSHVIPLAASA